jgi:hypothetical protein
MRLLDVQTYTLHTFYGDQIPPYAILSHTWLQAHEEVLFAHLQYEPGSWQHLPGARKVVMTCRQATQDGYSWAWVDTCCIDKTDSSELSESINSMFKWYQQAGVCYVFLTDIDHDKENNFLRSRWWTRAWTLQELLAPELVEFFDMEWRHIGNKAEWAAPIAEAMNIDIESLYKPRSMHRKSVAQRISWAAKRQATRAEDLAYSLLGIFRINMSMQYGEGNEAFVRLQKEIMRTTDDLSLFAWDLSLLPFDEILAAAKVEQPGSYPRNRDRSKDGSSYHIAETSIYGMFAPAPSHFMHCKDVEFFNRYTSDARMEEQNGNLTLHAPMAFYQDVVDYGHGFEHTRARDIWHVSPHYRIALLPCGIPKKPYLLIGLLLSPYINGSRSTEPNGEIRSTRIMFKGPKRVSTFLISSDTMIHARVTRTLVDSQSRKSQFAGHGKMIALRRALIIDCKTDRLSRIRVIGKNRWEVEETTPYVRLTQQILVEEEVTNTVALRYSTDRSGWFLYILLELRLSMSDPDRIAMLSSKVSVHSVVELEEIWGNAQWSNQSASLCLPRDDRPLEASVKTQIVFNQAVSTLLISQSIPSAEKGSAGRRRSFESVGTIDSTEHRPRGLYR